MDGRGRGKFWLILILILTVCNKQGWTLNVSETPTVFISEEDSIIYPKEVFTPTNDEISRAVAVKPAASWGGDLRADKDVRILCLGGSNTVRDMEGHGYVASLDKYIKQNISALSYALNEGMGGQGATAFVGKRFNFEDWETSRWPNLVTFEFSVNSGLVPSFDVAKTCDRLMRSLMHKYRVNNVRIPEFLVFELFDVGHLYQQTGERLTIQSRMDKMQELSLDPLNKPHGSGFNRGSQMNAFIQAFARFYGYPVLSWNEVGFPSFTRHFVSSGLDCRVNPWPYSDDGMHLNKLSAHFVIDHMLGPFLADQMKPRLEEVAKRSFDSHLYTFDMHMFKPEASTPFKIIEYNSWMSNQTHTLSELVVPNVDSKWRFMQTYAHQKDHGCYCSHNTTVPAVLQFDLPPHCTQHTGNPCSISLGLVRSWNESYIGETKCTLYRIHDSKSSGMHRKTLKVDVYKGSPFTHTAPEEHLMSSGGAGKYQIECYNVEEDKLSCLTSLSIAGVVTI